LPRESMMSIGLTGRMIASLATLRLLGSSGWIMFHFNHPKHHYWQF
jgi:hypothetical protein